MKRACYLSVVLSILVFIIVMPAVATPSVVLNGQNLTFDVPPIIEDGRTLVPLRNIFEALGANVSWDGLTQSITAKKDETIIKLQIGSQTAYKNNQPVPLDVPSKIVENRTLVPLRFVSEALGANVNWNDAKETIIIVDENTQHTMPKTVTLNQTSVDGVGLVNRYKIADNVSVGTNFNIDLLCISSAVGSGLKHPAYVSDNNNINNKIKAYFANVIDNKNAKKMFEVDLATSAAGSNSKFGSQPFGVMLGYDQILNNNLIYQVPYMNNQISKENIMTFQEMKSTLEQFAEESNAILFFKENREIYYNMVTEFVNNYNFNHVKRLEDFYGMDMSKNIFEIVLSATQIGGTAQELKNNQGGITYFNIMCPYYPQAGILNLLYHETAHNFLAPIRKNNIELINQYAGYANALNNQRDFASMLDETLARAVTVVMLDKYHSHTMAQENINGELQRGWKNTDGIYRLIQNEYVPNREKYKNFESFLPVILEYIKTCSLSPENSPASPNTENVLSSIYNEFTNCVTATRYKYNIVENGVRVTPDRCLIFKIDRSQLPESMKNFKKIIVPGTDSITKQSIRMTILMKEKTGRGVVDYDSEKGYGNIITTAPYYLVMLFDDNGKSLGYNVVDASKFNFNIIIDPPGTSTK